MKRRSFFGGVLTIPTLAKAASPSGEPRLSKFNPTRPVKLIVPYEPGGGMDILARVIEAALSQLWAPASLMMEYRPGAGTIIGTQYVAKSKPDGYTLGMIASPYVINPAIQTLPYDPEKDFSPLMKLGTSDVLLSCAPNMAFADLESALSAVKKTPGKYNCATPGVGSVMHFALEVLKQRAGLDMVHVPFNNAGKFLTEVFAGRIEFSIGTAFSALPHVRAGRLIPLATTGRGRNAFFQQTPTLAEFFPGLYAESMFGVVAPAGIDPDIAERIYQDISAVMKLPSTVDAIQSKGIHTTLMGPSDFAAFLSAEIKRWRGVAKQAGFGVS